MKKLIALGVGVLSAASLVIGASPVKASPADPIVDEAFCAGLVLTVATSQANADATQALLNAANNDLSVKRGLLDSAVVEWVQAFGQHLITIDTPSGKTAASQAVLDAAAAQVTQAVGP